MDSVPGPRGGGLLLDTPDFILPNSELGPSNITWRDSNCVVCMARSWGKAIIWITGMFVSELRERWRC